MRSRSRREFLSESLRLTAGACAGLHCASALIGKFFDAIERTKADNLIGLAFFNESNVPPENRKAVYAGIRRFL